MLLVGFPCAKCVLNTEDTKDTEKGGLPDLGSEFLRSPASVFFVSSVVKNSSRAPSGSQRYEAASQASDKLMTATTLGGCAPLGDYSKLDTADDVHDLNGTVDTPVADAPAPDKNEAKPLDSDQGEAAGPKTDGK